MVVPFEQIADVVAAAAVAVTAAVAAVVVVAAATVAASVVAAAAVVVVVAGYAVAAFAVRMTAEQRSKGFVLMGPFRVEQLK